MYGILDLILYVYCHTVVTVVDLSTLQSLALQLSTHRLTNVGSLHGQRPNETQQDVERAWTSQVCLARWVLSTGGANMEQVDSLIPKVQLLLVCGASSEAVVELIGAVGAREGPCPADNQ